MSPSARFYLFVTISVLATQLAAAIDAQPESLVRPAEIIRYLPSKDFARGSVTLTDGTTVKGYLQQRQGLVRVQRRERDTEHQEFSPNSITAIQLRPLSDGNLRKAWTAIRNRDFAAAVQLCSQAEKDLDGKPAYFLYVQAVAQKGQQQQDQALEQMRVATDRRDAKALVAALTVYEQLISRRTSTAAAKDIVTEAWANMAHRITSEERQHLQEAALKTLRMRLNFDPNAMQYLEDARAAFTAGEQGQSARLFARALDSGAPFEDDDHLNFARSLLATGKKEAAGAYVLGLPSHILGRQETRDIMAEADLIAPKFSPKILTYAFFGGKGNQHLNDVEFDKRGTIIARSADRKFQVQYAANGTRLIGVTGDPNGEYEPRKLPYAVKLNVKNPWDATQWKVGYKQVQKLLQQPYLTSPHGWHWWNWSHAEASKHALMADSRANYLAFPNPEHFIVMAWGDGGNTTISRHPQDLNQKENLGRGSVKNSCKLFLGEQKTGRLVNAFNTADRASAIFMDQFGMTYVSTKPAAGVSAPKSFSGNRHVIVFNPDLTPKHHFQFNVGNVLGIAVRENIMVVVGRSGREIAKQTKTVNSPKPAWQEGDDDDGVLIIVRLW